MANTVLNLVVSEKKGVLAQGEGEANFKLWLIQGALIPGRRLFKDLHYLCDIVYLKQLCLTFCSHVAP